MNGTCKGRLDGQINEGKTNDTLRYLQGLFDVPKYIHEHPRKADNSSLLETDIPNMGVFNNLKKIVDVQLAKSKFNKVDLGALFSFMNQ